MIWKQDIKEGDKVYHRNRQQSTTSGPWEPQPHTVTDISHNLITGTRDGTSSSRDRADWKKVHERPAHLNTDKVTHAPAFPRLPTLHEEEFKEGDLSDEEEGQTSRPRRPATRATTRRETPPPAPTPPPQPNPPTEDPDDAGEDGTRNDQAVQRETAPPVQPGQGEPTPPEYADTPPTGDTEPTPPGNSDTPPTVDTEYSPVDRYDDPRDKNLCRHCHTMVKMTTGRRTCTHYCTSKGYAIAADPDQSILAITDTNDSVLAQVAYIRGYENHPDRGTDDAIDEMEAAMLLTNTHILPEEESSTEGADDTASSDHVDSDNPDDSDQDLPP